MKKIRYCSICNIKIFKIRKRKPNFFEAMAGLDTYEEKTTKEWLDYDDTYVCQDCYEKILNDYEGGEINECIKT